MKTNSFDWLVKIVFVIVIVAVIIAVPIGCWFVARKVNYAIGYRGMVHDEIRQMVKPESLRQ